MVTKKVTKLIIYLIPAALFLFLLQKNIAPLGKEQTVKYDFKENSQFISALKPADRVSEVKRKDGFYYQALRDNIVYFDLKLPGGVRKANIKVKFKNTNNSELLVGVKDKKEWHYQIKPLDNKFLNTLRWELVKDKDLIIFQKRKRYAKVKDFLINPPQEKVAAAYNYAPALKSITLKNYKKSNEGIVLDHALRGPHTLYTYIKNETLDFTIRKQDLNWYKGTDKLTINVFKDDKKIFSITLDDDGIRDNSHIIKNPQLGRIQIPDLEEGVYKIELDLSEDVLIKKIVTRQKLLVFENQLFVADSKAYPQNESKTSVIFADAKGFDVKTYHNSALQVLRINGNKKLEIEQTHTNYPVNLPQGLNKIVSEKSDIIINGPAFFAFSKKSFFQPKPYKTIAFNKNTNLGLVDFIVAGYVFPRVDDGWYVNQQAFDLSKAYIKDGIVSFAFFAPELKEKNSEILINRIEVTLIKPSIFEYQTSKKLAGAINSFLGKK